jgi:hypothetical protein
VGALPAGAGALLTGAQILKASTAAEATRFNNFIETPIPERHYSGQQTGAALFGDKAMPGAKLAIFLYITIERPQDGKNDFASQAVRPALRQIVQYQRGMTPQQRGLHLPVLLRREIYEIVDFIRCIRRDRQPVAVQKPVAGE